MTEERKIKAALKVDASQIQVPPDMLDRISRRADTVTPVRPSLWARWRLGPKLEVALACVLLAGLVGVASYRNLNSTPTPAGGDQGLGSVSAQASIPKLDIPELTRMSRAVVIGTVKEKSSPVTVNEQEGDRTVQRVYTDYRFAVSESLRGPYSVGQEITLRLSMPGGAGYQFQTGDHVLLFLASNTGPAGEAYILTAEQGIFDVQGEIARPRMSHLAEVSLSELRATITGSSSSSSQLVQSQGNVPSTESSLSEVRKKVSFPVFVPAEVSHGLTPSPQIGDGRVRIVYLSGDGTQELSVLNGPAGCCLDAVPGKTGQATPIRNGITGHFLINQPEFGGPILWWQETGTYVALSGPHLTKEELVRIAASMSSTASFDSADSSTPRTGGFPCGAEVINAEYQGYNADARDCLWQSYQGGKYAEFTTTAPAEEGNPITYRVRVVSSNQIDVELDTTKDRLGDQRITKWTCSTMEMISIPSGKIAGAIERRSFTFRGCTGGDSSEVHIPW